MSLLISCARSAIGCPCSHVLLLLPCLPNVPHSDSAVCADLPACLCADMPACLQAGATTAELDALMRAPLLLYPSQLGQGQGQGGEPAHMLANGMPGMPPPPYASHEGSPGRTIRPPDYDFSYLRASQPASQATPAPAPPLAQAQAPPRHQIDYSIPSLYSLPSYSSYLAQQQPSYGSGSRASQYEGGAAEPSRAAQPRPYSMAYQPAAATSPSRPGLDPHAYRAPSPDAYQSYLDSRLAPPACPTAAPSCTTPVCFMYVCARVVWMYVRTRVWALYMCIFMPVHMPRIIITKAHSL